MTITVHWVKGGSSTFTTNRDTDVLEGGTIVIRNPDGDVCISPFNYTHVVEKKTNYKTAEVIK